MPRRSFVVQLAEREAGRVRQELRRIDAAKEDMQDKLNIAQNHIFTVRIHVPACVPVGVVLVCHLCAGVCLSVHVCVCCADVI
jgi:hypothetical protein